MRTRYGAAPEAQVIVQNVELPAELDEEEVKQILQGELDAALGQDGGQLSQDRLEALKYYNGEKLGTEVPGRSEVVMRSVLEAVEWVLPALLRIFTASDRICVVEPTTPEQEEQAEIATDYLNHVFYKDNNGFMILHDFFKDALLERLGWVKVYFSTTEENTTKSYTHITEDEFDALLGQEGTVTVVKKRTYTEQVPAPPSIMLSLAGLTGAPAGLPATMTGEFPATISGSRITGAPAGFPATQSAPPNGAPAVPPATGSTQPNGAPAVAPATGAISNGAPAVAPATSLAPPATPMTVPARFIDCTIKVTKPKERVIVENCPPEEILFSRFSKRGNVPFLAHRTRRTFSDLVRDGYDSDTLELVPMDDAPEQGQERFERYKDEQGFPDYNRTDSLRSIWVEECYVYLAPGDEPSGTELYKITTSGKGKVILTRDGEPDFECVPEIPFFSITPIPAPHKLTGLSLADLTKDIQLIKSTLIRQMLDNGYLSNWPRIEVSDDVVNENTYDDLLNLQPGNVVRTRRVGGITPLTVPYTADKTFPLVEYLDQTQEVRTGVARHNQGINPDDLNKTATGVSLLQQAAAQRVELFARIFAIGLQQMLGQMLNLIRRHQQQKRIIKVTGRFLTVDPTEWADEMPVTVSVGLGTGNRDQTLAYLMQILNVQATIVTQQGGLSGPIVYGKNVFDVLSKLCENAGFKEPFFADPTRPPSPELTGPLQAPKPDPAAQAIMAKTQATIQAAQAKAANDVQIAQIKAQLEAQLAQKSAENDAQVEQIRSASKLQLEQQKAQHDMQVEALKAHNDMAIARMQAESKAQMDALEIRLKYQSGAYTPGQAPVERGGMNGSGL